jgi:hypothetical protein
VSYIPKYKELEALTDDELIARYDAVAVNTVVGTGFYREELVRRQMAKESTKMLKLTQTMSNLTWVILGLTAVNAVLVAFQLWQS